MQSLYSILQVGYLPWKLWLTTTCTVYCTSIIKNGGWVHVFFLELQNCILKLELSCFILLQICLKVVTISENIYHKMFAVSWKWNSTLSILIFCIGIPALLYVHVSGHFTNFSTCFTCYCNLNEKDTLYVMFATYFSISLTSWDSLLSLPYMYNNKTINLEIWST